MDNNVIVKRNSSDELMHFKYIKRKKVNGKWRYYYDTRSVLGYDAAEAKNRAKNAYNDALQKEALARGVYQSTLDGSGNHKRSTEALNNLISKMDNRKNAEYVTNELVKKYSKTPIGRLEGAANKVKDLLGASRGKMSSATVSSPSVLLSSLRVKKSDNNVTFRPRP